MRRWLAVGTAALGVVVLVVGIGAYRALWLRPAGPRLPLHPSLVSGESAEGAALLAGAVAADHDGLVAVFAAQERAAWCGVASTAMALSALRDPDVAQADVFTPAAADVRSSLAVTTGGMTLDQLGGILRAHGARVDVTHAGDADLAAFEAALQTLADPSDVLLVNYHRAGVHQDGVGHISPVGAWNADADRVLVLDVSAYKYPPVWVQTDTLFAAMDTLDDSSGRTRGWVRVTD